jgi:hypothetical protein
MNDDVDEIKAIAHVHFLSLEFYATMYVVIPGGQLGKRLATNGFAAQASDRSGLLKVNVDGRIRLNVAGIEY